MHIGILGINHKSAPLFLRDKLAKACAKRFQPKSLHTLPFVPLSTCNRTEIYFSSSDLPAAHNYLLHLLRQLVEQEFEHCLYSYFGIDAFLHLARVTSGMDSAIVGETEIQGQVKQAYEASLCNHDLHFLFQKSLKIGKEVRSKSLLNRGLVTLEDVIWSQATEELGSLERKRILFVGVSKINEKVAARFRQKGALDITFCNRSDHKVKGPALAWKRLHEWQTFDLIIFGTKSTDYLVGPQTLIGRKKRLLVDLSVPRNVDPRLRMQIRLLNIDQLNREIDRKRELKVAALEIIEKEIIEKGVQRLFEIFTMKRDRAIL
ncbi:MAG: Glutamyl-tRNA reductase [Chlamydiales bacterium]|nr:Glutamyl-tRNA reductase [Chlamydiales bacterium]